MKDYFWTMVLFSVSVSVSVSVSLDLSAGVLKIESNPRDCEVFVINAETGKKSPLGKTPYEGDVEGIAGSSGQKGAIQLSLHKPGFADNNIVVPVLGGSDINLKLNMKAKSDVELTQDVDLLIGDLFDVLRMIRVKDYSNSLKKLGLLEKKFPYFSIIFEMKGAVYYLTKEFKSALSAYRKAFGVNPRNREAYRMKIYLEKKFKVEEQ